MLFSGSRAISDAFEALKQRFGPMLGLWAVFFVIQMVLMFGLFALIGAAGMAGMAGGMDGPNLSGTMILGVFVIYLVYFYVYAASAAALAATASPLKKAPFADALGIGFRSGLPMLGVYVLLFIAYVILAIVFGIAVAAIGAVAGESVAAILAIIVAVVGLTYALTKISLIAPVVAVDNVRNPITAITRSWSMTKGATLKMFLVYVALGIVATIAFGALFAPMLSGLTSAATMGQPPDIGGMVGQFAFIFVGLLILSVVFSLAVSALIASIHSQLTPDAGERIGDTFA